MVQLFRGVDYVFCYILIISNSVEKHKQHVNNVLRILKANGLRINHKKCNFQKTAVLFSSYTVNGNGVKPPEDRVKAIAEYDLSLTYDASDTAIGAVLEHYNRGTLEPLGFFSKKLSET
ncbi:uncharacterized protein LOC135430486 [Drosophila montana]|uniref:uncharacterized protein LOC135430486 n=1 Tax=Drosophila montana TaxID=40370 RepID=UPI00313EFC28